MSNNYFTPSEEALISKISIIIGCCIVLFSCYQLATNVNLIANGHQYIGEVVAYKYELPNPKSYSYQRKLYYLSVCPIVQFDDENGHTKKFSSHACFIYHEENGRVVPTDIALPWNPFSYVNSIGLHEHVPILFDGMDYAEICSYSHLILRPLLILLSSLIFIFIFPWYIRDLRSSS